MRRFCTRALKRQPAGNPSSRRIRSSSVASRPSQRRSSTVIRLPGISHVSRTPRSRRVSSFNPYRAGRATWQSFRAVAALTGKRIRPKSSTSSLRFSAGIASCETNEPAVPVRASSPLISSKRGLTFISPKSVRVLCVLDVVSQATAGKEDSMTSEARMIGYELLKKGVLVSFRILEDEVLTAPDEAEFGLRLLLKFVQEESEEDFDEDEIAENTAEWGAFGFIFILALLSF